jgi:hypothetical protein
VTLHRRKGKVKSQDGGVGMTQEDGLTLDWNRTMGKSRRDVFK